jgi:hypothetical protein
VRHIAILGRVWVFLSVAVLLYCQYVFDGQPNSDSEEVLVILMFILSFPASFVAGAVVVGVAFGFERLFHTSFRTSRLEMVFVWGLFFTAGYIQWFKAVPRARVKLKSSLTGKGSHSQP